MEEKNQQEKMAVARQVELFENAFNYVFLYFPFISCL